VLIKLVRTGATAGAVNFPIVEPARLGGARRILNVHRNVPGVLRDINKIVSDLQANIRSQTLATDPEIGYLVMDLDQDVSTEVHRRIAALPTNIRTRIV
jgi:D-3-phosphoglycerate dehydrogenase / 2-oxoglutarate reductase